MTTESRAVWLERTRSNHGHGGPGWDLGSCLWSPSTDRAGNDRYRVMRDPQVGDVVIHLVDSILLGQSVVAGPCLKVDQSPPSPAPWDGLAPYYRIDLRDYRPFGSPCPLSRLMRECAADILSDIRTNAPDRYPFFATASGSLFPVQGAYLTKCSPMLFELIRGITGSKP